MDRILKIMKLAVGSNLFQGFKALFRSNVLFRLIATYFVIIMIVLDILKKFILSGKWLKILCCRRKNVPQTFKNIVILKGVIGKYRYITNSYLVKIRSP